MLSIWILGITPNTDSGIGVFREFRARDGHGVIVEINERDIRADGVDAQLLPVEIFFNVKQNSGIDLFFRWFTIGEGESESKELDFGFVYIGREMRAWTLGIDTDFRFEVVG